MSSLQQSGDLCFATALCCTHVIFENLRCIELYLQELKNGKIWNKVQKLGGSLIIPLHYSKSVSLNSMLEIHLYAWKSLVDQKLCIFWPKLILAKDS